MQTFLWQLTLIILYILKKNAKTFNPMTMWINSKTEISQSVNDNPGKSHENTANLDESNIVGIVVYLEVPDHSGYGPRHRPYPKSTVTWRGTTLGSGILSSIFVVFQ